MLSEDVLLYRPAGAPAEMVHLIGGTERLTHRLLVLFGTHGGEVPDLRGLLGGLDRDVVGDIGDFSSLAAQAYECVRDRCIADARTMDFIEAEVRRAVVDIGMLLRGAREEVLKTTSALNEFLQRDAVQMWESSSDKALERFTLHVAALHKIEREAIGLIAEKARDVEEWIDTVRTLKPVPSAQQQLAARTERMNEIMKGLAVTEKNGVKIVLGGPEAVIEQILKRGDLLAGDVHSDPAFVRWLAANMSLLRRNGVEVMMVELFQTGEQSVLTNFAVTGGVESLNVEARKATTRGDNFADANTELYAAARREGIRIVAMDNAFRHWNETLSDRVRVANPYWAARYQQIRSELPADQRVAIIGGIAHSRAVSGVDGLVGGLYTIDQYYPAMPHEDIDVPAGAVAVHPYRPLPMPTQPTEDTMTTVHLDDSDFIFHAP